jgi:hypothetical protein
MRCGTKRRSSLRKHPWFLLILALTACRITPHGEWNALECSDDLDNDGDDLIDCEDPDCWAFACKHTQPTPPIDAGSDAHTPDAALVDANSPDVMTMPLPVDDSDSGPISMDDSGEPDFTCTRDPNRCKPDEKCLAGVCKPIDIRGDYTLQILSAVVPDQNLAGVCYDFDLSLCTPPDCSTCEPDPYVVVKKRNIATLGMTARPTSSNTDKPTWTEPGFPITIADDDTLQFIVWDADGLLSSEIFSCSPDLRQLPTGMLRCSPRAGSTIDPPSGTVFEVVARVTKLP